MLYWGWPIKALAFDKRWSDYPPFESEKGARCSKAMALTLQILWTGGSGKERGERDRSEFAAITHQHVQRLNLQMSLRTKETYGLQPN